MLKFNFVVLSMMLLGDLQIQYILIFCFVLFLFIDLCFIVFSSVTGPMKRNEPRICPMGEFVSHSNANTSRHLLIRKYSLVSDYLQQ